MAAYLGVLRGVLTKSVPLTVTSAERDANSQAAAMLAKLNAKGEGELLTVYGQNSALIKQMLKLPRTTTAWAAFIATKGSRLSRHLSKGALDLRTKDLTSAQLDLLKKMVTATGGRPYVEYDHLHVDLPAKYAVMSVAEVTVKRGAKVWLATSVVGAVLVGALIYRDRRSRRASAVPMKAAA